MAQPNKQAKTMSSRLLTMKFMQRAAAGSPGSSPSSTPTEPTSKRQRLSNGPYTPTPPATPKSDTQAIEEAIAAEEQKRQEALEREAASRGETKWYLSFKEPASTAESTPLRIVSAGYSALDSATKERSSEEDEEVTRPQIMGRRSFGKFNRMLERQQDPDASSPDSSSESSFSNDEDEDESDDPTGARALIAQSRREAGDKARSERKTKRKADKVEAERLADERRKKHVKLNHLNSISASGGSQTKPSSNWDATCFACGKKGHMRRDCPQSSQSRPSRR